MGGLTKDEGKKDKEDGRCEHNTRILNGHPQDQGVGQNSGSQSYSNSVFSV